MSPLKFLPHALTFVLACSLTAQAQTAGEFLITKVEYALVDSPTTVAGTYVKRAGGGGQKGKWLEIETTFTRNPVAKAPLYTDDVTFNYYVLLKKVTPDSPRGTLLVGSVTHVNIPQEKDLHSVMYVSPRSLEKIFDGKVPTAVSSLVIDAGVGIGAKGQEVAFASSKPNPNAWWNTAGAYKPVPGFLVDKNESPFAPFYWDYFEPIKPKASGQ